MKRVHEARFSDIPQVIRASFVDHTKDRTFVPAITGGALNEALGWGLGVSDLQATVGSINEYFKRLEQVPESSLEIMAIAVDRGRFEGMGNGVVALIADVAEACGELPAAIQHHVQILALHDVALVDRHEGRRELKILGPDWPMWEDLKRFAKLKKFAIADLVVRGQLSLLD